MVASGGVIDIGHVRAVDFQHAKAHIAVPVGVTLPFEDFGARAADAFFRNFTDVTETKLSRR